MKKFISIAVISVALSGCSSLSGMTDFWSDDEQSDNSRYAQQSGQQPAMNVVNIQGQVESSDEYSDTQMQQTMQQRAAVNNYGTPTMQPQFANSLGVYGGQFTSKHIGHYVKMMAQDLVANMEYVTNKTPVAVTTFAVLDSDLQQTNLLGYQLAESFMHELHMFRIPVIDYKATEYIRVTEKGDFILSRDFLELSNNAPVNYILTGTMTRHHGGVLLNARMLGLKNKAVVASAQTLLPFHVVDALIPSEQKITDGVQLIQGE